MDQPEPLFIGFLAKRVAARPEGLGAPAVERICSVSECQSSAPLDRIETMTFNGAGLYDTEAEALAVVPEAERADHELHGYRAHPFLFDAGVEEVFDPREIWPEPAQEPDLSGYERLGFDVVGWGETGFFECSPLSCQGLAERIPVNRHCLVDDLEAARELGRGLGPGDDDVEPVTYHVVEVLARRP